MIAQRRLVLQEELTECGLACLVMVLKKFGGYITLAQLRRQFDISVRGTSVADLIRLAFTLHLQSIVYYLKAEQVASLACPAILYWNNNHYVVLEKTHPRHGYYILDPAQGAYWLAQNELNQHFSNFAIALKPQQNFNTFIESKLTTKFHQVWLKFAAANFLSKFFWVTVITFLLQMVVVLFPNIIQNLIDPVVVLGGENLLQQSILLLIVFKICEALLHGLRALNIARIEQSITSLLGLKVFQHLLHLPMDYFIKRLQSTIYARFNSIDKIRELISRGLAEGIIDGLFSVFILGILCFLNWQIGLITIAFTMLYLIINFYLSGIAQQYNQQQFKERSKENSFFMQCLRGINTIKIFAKEPICAQRWFAQQQKYLRAAYKVNHLQSLLDSARILLFGGQLITVLLISLRLLKTDRLTVGQLYAIIFYISILTKNIASIASKYFDMHLLFNHAQRLDDILLTSAETKSQQPLPAVNSLQLDKVYYRHHANEPWILKNINMSFAAGECVMFFGRSGCGKSTLFKILMGLTQPTRGNFYVNRRLSVTAYLASYKKQISAVLQDDELFCGSIYDNISFFAETIDYQKVHQCAMLAEINKDIEQMPMKYHSYIGDMGLALSGGQKQRILLARALYSEPKILFLDEAFSHLDVATEFSLLKTLRNLQISLLIITHRPESLGLADRVIRMEQLSDS